MPAIEGPALRAWRRAHGWDVPAVSRQMRAAARDDPLPVHDALVRMIRRWERHGLTTERYELLYRALGFADEPGRVPAPGVDTAIARADIGQARDVRAWLTGTNTSDDAIEEIDRAASYLAEIHSRLPSRTVLAQVLGVHQSVQDVLRGGRQRLRQTRELLRIDSAVLAHAALLLGDLGDHAAAGEYGTAALMSAREADADEGIAWSVLSKTARWQNRFAEAAGLARRGFETCARAAVRAELAYREANAVARLGDAPRAQVALRRAESAAENLTDDGVSVWSFPPGRQAVFALSVRLHTGDPDSALRVAGGAEAYWEAGGAKVTATWAQVKAGSALAHLRKASPDGAASQLRPVLELPPEQRIRTVTGYLDEADRMLRDRRFAGSRICAELREQILEFTSATSVEEGDG